jgi:hypothetical protein
MLKHGMTAKGPAPIRLEQAPTTANLRPVASPIPYRERWGGRSVLSPYEAPSTILSIRAKMGDFPRYLRENLFPLVFGF